MQQTRDDFVFGDLKIKPREAYNGYIKLADGKFELPVAILHGEQPGKTVLITAGIHPAEYVGIQAAIELALRLKVEKVKGTVIIVKVALRDSFEQRAGSLGIEDGLNLNRVFPGDSEGTPTQQLAWAISSELYPLADYCIDLHSGDSYEELTPYVYYVGKAEDKVVETACNMAKQVDVPYMVKSNVGSGGGYNYAGSIGIPSILIERGGMGGWTPEEVRSTRRDVRNILCALEIYDGQQDERNYYPVDVVDVVYQAAREGGLWYPTKKPGEVFHQGEVLGQVRGYDGHLQEVSIAEYDGVILYQVGSLQVPTEGIMIAYGKIKSSL